MEQRPLYTIITTAIADIKYKYLTKLWIKKLKYIMNHMD